MIDSAESVVDEATSQVLKDSLPRPRRDVRMDASSVLFGER
ncbi:hypothetical protein RBWH47_02967 [Rhodopirellula baltica WH47]|uniref:Uncharacterized protein n=1 Tax=Rhodopirellula baltica WH47 TaxID=991778 RepID=F2AUM9_RHOBT|nr:hypothetical protein RBWH47_02967 [Rhodopirellula baltica WH47]